MDMGEFRYPVYTLDSKADLNYGEAQDMLWPVTPQGRLQFMVDLVNTVKKAPNGLGVMDWAPERDFWNEDGTPGPVVFTLDNLSTLTKKPESKTPAAANQ